MLLKNIDLQNKLKKDINWHYSYAEKIINKWPSWKKKILELDIETHKKE